MIGIDGDDDAIVLPEKASSLVFPVVIMIAWEHPKSLDMTPILVD